VDVHTGPRPGPDGVGALGHDAEPQARNGSCQTTRGAAPRFRLRRPVEIATPPDHPARVEGGGVEQRGDAPVAPWSDRPQIVPLMLGRVGGGVGLQPPAAKPGREFPTAPAARDDLRRRTARSEAHHQRSRRIPAAPGLRRPAGTSPPPAVHSRRRQRMFVNGSVTENQSSMCKLSSNARLQRDQRNAARLA
jgi:hypothetical protein